MNLDLRLDGSGDFYARKFQPDLRSDRLILNMGPQHPSTHGVLRILLEVDGEYIVRAEPVLGYVHRMQEKMGEIRTYPQYLPNMGRVDYLHALAWNWAYVGAVERLMGIEVPPRAEFIRVITCELNRIKSHLLWWGAYLLDLGAFTPIMYAFADRERLMDILQRITGSRLTFCYYRFGGVSTDVDQRFIEEVRAFCHDFDERLKTFTDLVTDNVILRSRVEEVGEISPEVCRDYGATGPVLRGSGVGYDVRRAEPYSVYPRLDFQIPVYDQCDAMARYLVRMDEMRQSVAIVLQALDALPPGDHIHPLAPRRPCPPPGDVYFSVESARGQVGVHLVSDGGESPYRLKLRSPSFSNLSLLSDVAEGSLISDAVSTLGSLDLVIPEIDR
ncbi:NADH-quinone oxidoreductase subunit D [Desulfonatronum thioautotrophicum]|uniref:NADH-quinone oxidoreductase subunit D n=1 Tax=Desulfonatronum thioautotrophicum TaxID=617001 RepID=UPI0005EBD413|nr:NADH-quinone oxidoreductase subunit D [Desulfonatronum thioautotrophicum]